jgi:hypothetical protein
VLLEIYLIKCILVINGKAVTQSIQKKKYGEKIRGKTN